MRTAVLLVAIATFTLPAVEAARSVRVAAVQMASRLGEVAWNRDRCEALVRQAAGQGARIVVLPEAALTGYMSQDLTTTWQVGTRFITAHLAGRDPTPVAEPADGESVRRFAALARELKLHLTIPFVERDDEGRFFNAVTLAGPAGILAHYRKRNPWRYAEQGWASRGDELTVVDTEHGRLGLLICFDINFEPANLAALKPDLLLYSIAWVDQPGSDFFTAALPRVARELDCVVIGANWTVEAAQRWHGWGSSRIIDRGGRVLAQAGVEPGERVIIADAPLRR